MATPSYLQLLATIEEAIDVYASENPDDGVRVRLDVSTIDEQNRNAVRSHDVRRGCYTVLSRSDMEVHPATVAAMTQASNHNTVETIQARIDSVVALVENGNYSSAIDQANEAINLQPHNPDCHFALWRATRAAGQIDQARSAIVQTLSLLESADMASRVTNAEVEISVRESYAQWLYLLGELDLARDQTTQAIDLAQRAALTDRLDWLNLQLQTISEKS